MVYYMMLIETIEFRESIKTMERYLKSLRKMPNDDLAAQIGMIEDAVANFRFQCSWMLKATRELKAIRKNETES